MVGFDNGADGYRLLNEVRDDDPEYGVANPRLVPSIHSNLTAQLDVTTAIRLAENRSLCFQGPVKVGSFEIDADVAQTLLASPNPHRKPNTDVVRPWLNGRDITARPTGRFIIDFGTMSMSAAALYEAPFEYLRRTVLPQRLSNRDRQRRENWWRLGRSGADLKRATEGLPRFICTPRVARHRLFVWVPTQTLPDSRLFAFARSDDYFFGVLQSRVHECWSLATSSRHGDGTEGGRPTYNNTTCFETFPLPWPPRQEPPVNSRIQAIGDASRLLTQRREEWLNPPDASEPESRSRTLTKLYNARPMWLKQAHEALDRAVLDAYGWPNDLSDSQLLERLFALNRERFGAEAEPGGQLGLPEPAVVSKPPRQSRTTKLLDNAVEGGSQNSPRPRRRPALELGKGRSPLKSPG
jgi:hypothetical protein